MGKNSDILIGIYKKAKAKRIVLNQTEFAQALGYSRVHLFDKMIKSTSEIPDSLIEKANEILNNTINVSRETNNDAAPLYSLEELKIKIEEQWKVIMSQRETIHSIATRAPDIGEGTKNGSPSSKTKLNPVK